MLDDTCFFVAGAWRSHASTSSVVISNNTVLYAREANQKKTYIIDGDTRVYDFAMMAEGNLINEGEESSRSKVPGIRVVVVGARYSALALYFSPCAC